MKKYIYRQQAFTLLEILIVMLIIGLLAGLGLMSFGTVQQKSRDSRRKQDLVNISKALEAYYNDKASYPLGTTSGAIIACQINAEETCVWGEVWQNSTTGTMYMGELPTDPVAGLTYYYQSAGNSYYLFAHLENEQDVDYVAAGYAGVNCGTNDNCNYVLMSNNLSAAAAPATN